MKVAVTGARGFVGHHVCEIFKKQGWSVVPITREMWDLAEKPNLLATLKGCDAVVHLAAYVHKKYTDEAKLHQLNVAASVALAEEAGKAGVKRFVFASTIGVYGAQAAEAVTEETPTAPHNPYAASKLAAEKALKSYSTQHPGLELVILRVPLVYGAHVPANFKALAKLAIKGWPLPFATLRVQRDMVGIHNLTEMIRLVLTSPISAGHTFVVKDGEDMPLKKIIGLLQLRPRFFPFPIWLLKGLLVLVGKAGMAQALFTNFKIDNTKARKLLDYRPVCSVAAEITAVKANLG